MIKNLIKNILLKPPYVKWCSQTIYQALLGCIKLYEHTKEEKWAVRSKKLYGILKTIQRPDGGFDIGYEFNFGLLHKKGESTSPEMVGLLAFTEYGRVFGFNEELERCCRKSVEWIKKFSIRLDEQTVMIPYAPYSTSQVMVYNGTSFVAGALGYYLGCTQKQDDEAVAIYNGMIHYLNKSLVKSDTLDGSYWPYYDQKRTDIISPLKDKIDYYHQMQQVEMHAYANSVTPVAEQKEIIEKASDHIVAIYGRDHIVPYTNNKKNFQGAIHLWGFSSVPSGLIRAAGIIKDKKAIYTDVALECVDFILQHAWNGQFFYPAVNLNGTPLDSSARYMVRSDAWVFNSLATFVSSEFDIPSQYNFLEVLEKAYIKMDKNDFSGLESHASNKQTRFIGALLNMIK